MKAETLKKAILQYAMQGKLVEQDPNDEPASVLLERIRAEKKQLIKDGKIKKERPLPPITEDEIPYELPKSWVLDYFENFVEFSQGIQVDVSLQKKEEHEGYVKFLRIINYTQPERADFVYVLNSPKHWVSSTDIVIVRYGATAGFVGYGLEGVLANNLFKINFDKNTINYKFLYYFCLYNYEKIKTNVHGNAMPAISFSSMGQLLFALPPLAEQERIVEKLEQVLPLVEEYGKNEEKLSKLNSTLPDKIKQSILQHAVQGKLVPQNPSDEPASELLKRIKAEKEQLIKDGKIKKEKPLPLITEDEIPYELPQSWEWVRLRDVVYNHGQKTPNQTFSYIDIGSINNKLQRLNINENIIKPEDAPSRARKIVEFGDVIYSTVRPYLHNMCIIDKDFSCEPIASTGFAVLCCHTGLYNKFLLYYLLSPDFDSYANNTDNSKGVAYPAINDDRLYKALVPIPPLAEQQRIVTKVEELLAIVDKIH